MKKSSFHLKEMDCPAEEHLIRMKLKGIETIKRLAFDINQRNLDVYHSSDNKDIIEALHSLKLGSELIQVNNVADFEIDDENSQKKLLWIVLLINLAFFILEMSTGFISKSMGLVADSLDMLADSLVYALSLFAVGSSIIRKKRIAKTTGYFQIILAMVGIIEVLRRFLGVEIIPDFRIMIVISILALIGNVVCLLILQKSRSNEAHMRASMIFTSNDVIINLGVIAAGVLVLWFDSNKPDLIIGSIVFIVVMRGAFRILSLAKE